MLKTKKAFFILVFMFATGYGSVGELYQVANNPELSKQNVLARKKLNKAHKVISVNGDYKGLPETITERLYKQGFKKNFARFQRRHT